jgi:hypothetical protein
MTAHILADLEFDLDSLSLGDLIDVERVSGVKVTDRALGEPPIALAVALLWVFGRRDNPDLTFEAVRAMPVTKLAELAPKGEAGEQPSPAGSKSARAR